MRREPWLSSIFAPSAQTSYHQPLPLRCTRSSCTGASWPPCVRLDAVESTERGADSAQLLPTDLLPVFRIFPGETFGLQSRS